MVLTGLLSPVINKDYFLDSGKMATNDVLSMRFVLQLYCVNRCFYINIRARVCVCVCYVRVKLFYIL